MKLSEAMVTRTWRADSDAMAYRMSVAINGEVLQAEHRVNRRDLQANRCVPAEYIERDLAGKIIRHIRESLFPKL